jgi:hypothetical protein
MGRKKEDTADVLSSREPATGGAGGRVVTPVKQTVEPAGRQVYYVFDVSGSVKVD